MAWRVLSGRENSFHLHRNGKTYKATLPNTRVYDPSSGVFEVRLDTSKQDFAVAEHDGGFIALWYLGAKLFAICKQPVHSQAYGFEMDMDGVVKRTTSAAAITEDNNAPPEVKTLL